MVERYKLAGRRELEGLDRRVFSSPPFRSTSAAFMLGV
jgi:hypothetical protein